MKMAYPKPVYVQLILLKYTQEHGDIIYPLKDTTVEDLALFFNLSEMEKTYVSETGVNRWFSRVETVHQQLLNSGEMEDVDNEGWKISHIGYERIIGRWGNNLSVKSVTGEIEDIKKKIQDTVENKVEKTEKPAEQQEPVSQIETEEIQAQEEEESVISLPEQTEKVPGEEKISKPLPLLKPVIPKMVQTEGHAKYKEIVDFIYKYLIEKKLFIIERNNLQHMINSLMCDPLLFISGRSGIGKTELAIGLSEALQEYWGKDKTEIFRYAVHGDFGYSDMVGKVEGEYQPGDLAKHLFLREDRYKFSTIVVLDNMDTCSPEKYFAPFLSAVSSKLPVILPNGKTYDLPSNVYFIGTVGSWVKVRNTISTAVFRTGRMIFMTELLDTIMLDSSAGAAREKFREEIIPHLLAKIQMESPDSSDLAYPPEATDGIWNLIERFQLSETTKITTGQLIDMLKYICKSGLDCHDALDLQLRQKLLPFMDIDLATLQKLQSFIEEFKYKKSVEYLQQLARDLYSSRKQQN